MLYADDNDYDDDNYDDRDQVVGAPKPEKLFLRVFLVRFRQGGLCWSVIPGVKKS